MYSPKACCWSSIARPTCGEVLVPLLVVVLGHALGPRLRRLRDQSLCLLAHPRVKDGADVADVGE